MTALTLTIPTPAKIQRSGIRLLTNLFEGIREGCELASRYEAFARKSDFELARLGLKREDIPRAVMFNRKR